MSSSPGTPGAPRSEPSGSRVSWAFALAALVVVLAWAALSPPGANDLVGGDEGYYGIMARNVLASPAQWAVPSLSPLGPPGDKPPVLPLLIAAAIRVLGPVASAVRLPSLLSAWAVLVAAAHLARRAAGARAGALALGLLATLPWFADSSRVAAAELPLAAFGMAGLLAWTGAGAPARRGALAGVCFGLAFLCKLWLVALLAIPALLATPRAGAGRRAAAALLGGALVLAAHAALLLAVSPSAGPHWVAVVFGFSLASRVAGGGYAAYWHHPALWYAGLLARAFVLVLPLLAAGVLAAARAWPRPESRVLLGAFVPLSLLSAFAVKSGGYVYPLVPLAAVLAAWGAESLLAARPRAGAVTGALLVALALGGGAVRTVTRLPQRYHDTGARDVARALAPVLAGVAPDRAVLVAPEAPTFAFETFRTVRYWDTPYARADAAVFAAMRADTALRAFVVDPSGTLYGGGPDSTMLAWLATDTREITAEVAASRGRPLPLRVFVRR